MAKRRADDFDLRAVMARRDFTPAATDVSELLALATGDDEDVARDASLALARVPEHAIEAIRGARAQQSPQARARSARLLTRFPSDAARAPLLELLEDESAIVRRAAAQALARVGGEGVEEALLARFPGEDAAETRALAMALGRTGTERAAKALSTLDPANDEALAKIVERARLMLTRAASRTDAVTLDPDGKMPRTVAVELLCRSGLESMLAASLRGVPGVRDPKRTARGIVRIRLDASPRVLEAARLFYDLRFPLEDVIAADDFETRIADVIASEPSRALLRTFTRGTPRVRVAFEDGRKRRAIAWAVAVALDAHGIINDPEGAPWQAQVRTEKDGTSRIALLPRGLCEARFAYRIADVPASTHPTIAAAMASMCPTGKHEVVWDPFMGAGVELIERARLGAYQTLIGTDTDPRAIEAAKQNLERAGVVAETHEADATRFVPSAKPTTIITNPPMGRRVHRGDSARVLEDFIAHLEHAAAPRATLIWLNPSPAQTGPALQRMGFRLVTSHRIDMGGFDVSLERRERDRAGK